MAGDTSQSGEGADGAEGAGEDGDGDSSSGYYGGEYGEQGFEEWEFDMDGAIAQSAFIVALSMGLTALL